MKTIKEIAKNANYNCTIERHGRYCNYTLERNGRILFIEGNANGKFEFSANGSITDTTTGNYVYFSKCGYNGMTHIIANGDFAAQLTLEEIETLVNNN